MDIGTVRRSLPALASGACPIRRAWWLAAPGQLLPPGGFPARGLGDAGGMRVGLSAYTNDDVDRVATIA